MRQAAVMPLPVRTFLLFGVTALAEIVGCFLPYLWLRRHGSPWLLLPGAIWLLTLHPTGAGRTYAAYGGVYIATAILWLWSVEGQRLDRWDLLGAGLCLVGTAVIVLGPR